jgi:hypothetical protein
MWRAATLVVVIRLTRTRIRKIAAKTSYIDGGEDLFKPATMLPGLSGPHALGKRVPLARAAQLFPILSIAVVFVLLSSEAVA